jgi:ketosteroid isomerase-like protein
MTTEQQCVIETVQRMTHALFVHDIEGIMAAYEAGAVIVFEPGIPLSDEGTVRKRFQEMFALNPRFEYPNGHEVFITGEIAVHIAPWHMMGQAPNGASITDTGLSVAVLRRQSDGIWLMIFDDPYGSHLMAAAPNH